MGLGVGVKGVGRRGEVGVVVGGGGGGGAEKKICALTHAF